MARFFMVFIVFRYIKVTLKGNRTIFAPLADPIRTNFYVLMFVFFRAANCLDVHILLGRCQ